MSQVIIVTVGTLLILLAERLFVLLLTRRPAGREWIRSHWFLHPNVISFFRMPMGVASAILWLYGWQMTAFLWFAFWMITDVTDGDIARSCNLVTESGKWIDPLSDKLLYFPALLILALVSPVKLPLFWIITLIVIDTAGQFSRLFVKKKAANSFGKAKTALITVMISLAGLDLLYDFHLINNRFLGLLAISCVLLAFLSLYCKLVPDIWYANTFTFGNLVCGIGAIAAIYDGRLLLSFILVFLGQFFDLFDGRMARKFGSTRLGAVFDDIADGTSFGLATSLLVFAALGSTLLAFACAAIFCGCVIYRLLRFLRNQGQLPAGVFEGLPSPAGALLAGSSVLLMPNRLLAATLVLLASTLMVSHIRYRHFAQRIWPTVPNLLRVSLFVIVIVFVARVLTGHFSFTRYISIELVAFILSISYVLFARETKPKAAKGNPRET